MIALVHLLQKKQASNQKIEIICSKISKMCELIYWLKSEANFFDAWIHYHKKYTLIMYLALLISKSHISLSLNVA